MTVIDSLLAAAETEAVQAVYLVAGDRIVAEPAALRLAEAIARRLGCEPEVVRRPESLVPVLQDLRTFALFGAGKVVVVVESTVLADADSAAELVDEALEALPFETADADLGAKGRRAASRLMQALRLLQVDPSAGETIEVIGSLPKEVLAGGGTFRRKNRRRRSAAQIESARSELAGLLAAARRAEIHGWGESAEATLADVVRDGLPENHVLVLAESSCPRTHPLVRALEKRGAFVRVGELSMDRRAGWKGLEIVQRELERETGVGIATPAMLELARRTLRHDEGDRQHKGAAAESTARLGAEYRKLATLSGGATIHEELVQEVVEDRGEEDVWKILDAVGSGDAGAALEGIERWLRAAADVTVARLSLLSLLAGFCRQLAAVAGMIAATQVPASERSYARFKSRIAPRLQEDLPGGRKNPLAGLHPFRLHRVYLAASGVEPQRLALLPALALETERLMKGGGASPEVALVALVAEVAARLDDSSPSPPGRASADAAALS